MKVHRSLHALIGALLILFLIPSLLYGEEVGERDLNDTEILLLSSELSTANYHELVERARFLDLPTDGEEEELRRRLYAFYDLTSVSDPSSTVVLEQDFRVEILSADSLFMSSGPEGILLLEGNTSLSFTSDSEEGETRLDSDRMVMHFGKKRLTAMGSISYIHEGMQMEDILSGTMVTVDWEDGTVLLMDGETTMVRENSEDTSVKFFTTGEQIVFTGESSTIAFSQGMLTTNEEQAYFSIRANTLHLVDGGDLFVTNAKISLGRVPMLWVPFFYYPGKTFVFNPAIGVESERGMFFSSSTELYGRYPKIEKGEESSFTTLLSSDQGGESYKDGWVYSTGEVDTVSDLETWARTSGSYLSLLVDAYQNYGMFVGLDTVNNLSDDTIRLSAFGGFAFVGEDTSRFSSVYEIPAIRFAFEGSTIIDTPHIDITLKAPFYSDPKVMRTYGNRLTSFSLGALTGDPSFPTGYRSDITRFDWTLNGRISVPTTFLAPFLHTLRFDRLDAKVSWSANEAAEGAGYIVTSFVIPDMQMYAAGTIFSFTKEKSPEHMQKTDSPTSVEENLESTLDLEEWGIDAPYTVVPPSSNRAGTVDETTISLDYSFRQYVTDSNRLESGVIDEHSFYARTAGSVGLSAAIAPSLFTLKQQLEPVITFDRSADLNTENIALTSITQASVPFLGLSYDLQTKLFQIKHIDSNLGGTTSEGGWSSWNSDAVSRHQISWIQSYPLSSGTLSPSLLTILDPLPFSLRPKVSYELGNILTSFSYRIEEDSSGDLRGSDAIFFFSYTNKNLLEFASTFTYDTSLYGETSSAIDPLHITSSTVFHLFDSYASLSGKASYSFLDDVFSQFVVGASIPWAAVRLQGSGTFEDPMFDLLDTEISIDAFGKRWWKNRISLGLDVVSTYRHSFWDPAASQFDFKIDLQFKIEEFLTLDIALKSVNKGFHRYNTFSDVWQDLLDSFDFFGDGRQKTQFTMDAIEVSLIHHMADWDLHCKYEGSVVLSDMEWEWKPVFTIFLQWKAIPEIKVDREFDATTW
ncbi:hypothetical protein [Pleomorphochaeta sp. DL1XJH-081]|uniref:hypothetical protein n=1 Tax=Pleomorphochaeta sp. DL1XJH-081 TaxID=3409690 RepID=UPI003BB69FB3